MPGSRGPGATRTGGEPPDPRNRDEGSEPANGTPPADLAVSLDSSPGKPEKYKANQIDDDFEDPVRSADQRFDDLILDLDGFEGPIDVLLLLAREQKVDLKRISILELADQYLAFVARARRLSLELAADYLVMAAWLAFLKSRLLLPEPPRDGEPTGAELAEALAFQLRRLEAMQNAGKALLALPQLGRDFFRRGAPEAVRIINVPFYTLSLYDLLKAYSISVTRQEQGILHIEPLRLYSMDDALRWLGAVLTERKFDWTTLADFLPTDPEFTPLQRRAAMAATFAASLELARSGRLAIRQDGIFGPIYLKSGEAQTEEEPGNGGSLAEDEEALGWHPAKPKVRASKGQGIAGDVVGDDFEDDIEGDDPLSGHGDRGDSKE